MAKKPPIRVALDLETTGLHPEQDVILEVAAIKFQGSEVLDTFESFVAPHRSVPYRVQRLTGITPDLLAHAPSFDAIASRLQRFLGDFPIVGHSIPFDVSFLQRRGLARSNALIDTFELAAVLLPSLSSYNLGQVAASLGIHVPQDRHRAMVDTELAMSVFQALHQRLQAVDLSLLQDLAHLDAPKSWPLLHFFRQELRTRLDEEGVQGTADVQRGSFGNLFASQLGMDPGILSFAIARTEQKPSLPASEQPSGVDTALPTTGMTEATVVEQIASQVEVIAEGNQEAGREEKSDRDGAGSQKKAAQESTNFVTPQGYQTAQQAIHRALEQESPLLLEVVTGGMDYTPALLPTLEWLRQPLTERQGTKRLVIACASQQGARRLVETVLPELQATLHSQFPVAYWAERGGYLCPHRWFGAALRRTSGELTAEQARGMAKVGIWAKQTLLGERSELNLFPQELVAWKRISSGIERLPLTGSSAETMYERCTYRSKGYCFVSLAEERVRAAQIIVTTHAGLFDDLSSDHSLLSTIPCRLILDAEALEEENIRWSSAELEKEQLLTLFNTIGMELPNGRYQGLLALAAPSLNERGPGGLSTTPTVAKADLDSRLLSWFQLLRQASTAVERLFASYQRLLEEFSQQGMNGNGGQKSKGGKGHGPRGAERSDAALRFTSDVRTLAAWGDAERAWQNAAQRIQAVIEVVREAEKLLVSSKSGRNKRDTGSSDSIIVASELAAVAQQLFEQKRLGQQAMALAESDTVHWLRTPPQPFVPQSPASNQTMPETSPAQVVSPILYAQIIHTSTLLKRFLHPEQTGTIFAGTSLSVDNSFSFYRRRLGLEDETCPAFSVVTEHHEQTLLCIPNDVPEPNMPQYQRQLDETLIRLASALNGRLIALFTSYAALRSSYSSIKQGLENQKILVLGQGIDGSPRQLLSMFQSQERVVVLGTGSFWDSVEDVTGTATSPACLVIARLPMPVLNDPPTAARAEQYSDQIHQLTVPLAALRLKRALNRLAWNDNQRNTIVLFDRRVISKEYGPMIMHSLPRCSIRQEPASHLSETIPAWLADTGTWE